MGCEALYHEGTLFPSRSRAGRYGATLSLWCSSRGSFAFSALVFEEEDAAYPRERQSFKTLRLRSTQEASPANFAFTAFYEVRYALATPSNSKNTTYGGCARLW
jgi:hypothetical protein